MNEYKIKLDDKVAAISAVCVGIRSQTEAIERTSRKVVFDYDEIEELDTEHKRLSVLIPLLRALVEAEEIVEEEKDEE